MGDYRLLPISRVELCLDDKAPADVENEVVTALVEGEVTFLWEASEATVDEALKTAKAYADATRRRISYNTHYEFWRIPTTSEGKAPCSAGEKLH